MRLAAALILLAEVASAATGVTGISVQKWRNATSVAVQAIVRGDDDSSAVCRIFQKYYGGAGYDSGMTMTRRPGGLYEGRIMWLTPGRTVDFYVEANDSGTKTFSGPDTSSCTGAREPCRTGPSIYVNKATGNNAWNGLSPTFVSGSTGPVRDIQVGMNKLGNLPDTGPCSQVVVAPGIYYEQIQTNQFGGLLDFDGFTRSIVGDGTNPDSTIIDGSNEIVAAVAGGQFGTSPFTAASWSLRPIAGKAVDSVYKAYWPDTDVTGTSPGDSIGNIVLGWGETLNRKTSLAEMSTDAGGEASGFFWASDTLFIKRRDGTSPATAIIHQGYKTTSRPLVWVQNMNFRLANVTVRYSAYSGIGTGNFVGDATGVSVDSVRFYGNGGPAINFDHTGGTPIDSVTVSNCILDGLAIGSMPYAATKSRQEENSCQAFLRNVNSSFYRNTVRNLFNGVAIGTDVSDSVAGSRCEISYNTFTNTVDDAIEADVSHCINTLLLKNTMFNTSTGISACPVYSGPLFAFYNLVAEFPSRGFKTGSSTTGLVFAAHNTFTTSGRNVWTLDGASGANTDGIRFENNIFQNGYGSTTNVLGSSSGASTTTNSFNWNCYDDDDAAVFVWNSLSKSLAALRSEFGWETNGVSADPQLADRGKRNYGVKPSSPAFRAGRKLAGINTSLDGPLYVKRPNMGSETCPCVRP